jgi:hypothetical protein
VEAKAVIDSGASDDFLSRELVRRLGWEVSRNTTLIQDAFGETVLSEGSIILNLRLISESGEELTKETMFLVIESPIQVILGRESIKEWELVRHFPSHFCLPKEERKTDMTTYKRYLQNSSKVGGSLHPSDKFRALLNSRESSFSSFGIVPVIGFRQNPLIWKPSSSK